MAVSPDAQEELDIYSTSESQSVDLSDSGDDLGCIGVSSIPIDHQRGG